MSAPRPCHLHAPRRGHRPPRARRTRSHGDNCRHCSAARSGCRQRRRPPRPQLHSSAARQAATARAPRGVRSQAGGVAAQTRSSRAISSVRGRLSEWHGRSALRSRQARARHERHPRPRCARERQRTGHKPGRRARPLWWMARRPQGAQRRGCGRQCRGGPGGGGANSDCHAGRARRRGGHQAAARDRRSLSRVPGPVPPVSARRAGRPALLRQGRGHACCWRVREGGKRDRGQAPVRAGDAPSGRPPAGVCAGWQAGGAGPGATPAGGCGGGRGLQTGRLCFRRSCRAGWVRCRARSGTTSARGG